MTGAGIVIRLVSAGLMIGMPLAAAYFVLKRFPGAGPRFLLWGAGSFVFSQLLHLPFNRWVLLPGLENGLSPDWQGWIQAALTGVALGLSAGIFEECSRWLAFRLWSPEDRRWKSAVALGVGHGGLEAFLIGLLALFALVQAVVLENPAALEALGPRQAQLAAEQLSAYWETSGGVVLLGAVERLAAMLFHLGASVLVMQVFLRGSPGWLGATVLVHTGLNAAAVYGIRQWGVMPTEAVIFLLGGAVAVWGWRLRPGKEADPGEDAADREGPGFGALKGDQKGEVREEQLERSRDQ